MKYKIVRITTVPMSLKYLLKGQMAFMSRNGFDVIMISSDGTELKDVIENEKCRHFIISLTRKITPIQDLVAVFSLYRLLVREKPDIVHTHTPKAGIVGMLASFLARVPVRLHTVAGLPLMEAKGIKRVVLNLVEKLTYKFSSKVYPNSYGLKNIILKNRFITEDKLCVIGNGSSNGIDTSFFDPELFSRKEKKSFKSNLGIEKNNFIFLFVGRIVGDKGINELVAAFEKLSIENNNVTLLLVGPFEEELDPLQEKTLKTIKNNEHIISVGFQEDVRPYFAVANVLVFPSYREGFPNVVMQAGAMELPSIVTNINGCNEIIVNGENGIIIPVKNTIALKKEMQRLFEDTSLYIKLKLRSHIINRYAQELIWYAILDEYKKLLNKKS